MFGEFFALFGSLVRILGGLFHYWWIWSAPLSFALFVSLWVAWRQNLYKQGVTWAFLELKMPREVRKSPKAMEQFLAAIYGLRNVAGDFMELYWDGEVPLWFSLELVSFGGEIHFFIRTPAKHKNVLMANLYANYAHIDIEEVGDYMERFPKNLRELHEQGRDIWGTELVLGKPDAYPLHTYIDYQDPEEERSLDPVAAILEVFNKLHPKENVMVQILIRPADPIAWKTASEKIVKELKAKGMRKLVSPTLGEYEHMTPRTPGETKVLEAVERNISKQGYETLVRYIYICDKSVYDINFAKRGTLAAFNQYSGQDLNHFRHNYQVYTQVKWLNFPFFFPKRRAEARKDRILKNFIRRKLPEETTTGKFVAFNIFHANFAQKSYVLNTEELATLYHPPTTLVLTAPLIERVESKKLGPPAGLAIFEREEE